MTDVTLPQPPETSETPAVDPNIDPTADDNDDTTTDERETLGQTPNGGAL